MLDILRQKRLVRRALLVGLALVGLVAGAGAGPGMAHTPDKLFSEFGTPTIDGVRGPGEWPPAAEVPIFPAALPGSTLLVMNDTENLYIAASVTDPTLSGTDMLWIRFDNQRNGVPDDGDDDLFLRADGWFRDAHYEAAVPSWGILDGVIHGTGRVGAAAGVNFFEIAHPLNSGDPEDMAVVPGGSIGVCVEYLRDGVSASDTTFPRDCHLAQNAQSLYADLDLAFPYGDADCDGDVDAVDAALVLQYDAGLIPGMAICGAPDANRDGILNAVDAALILQYVAGLVPHLSP
jgi:hypothetical protein